MCRGLRSHNILPRIYKLSYSLHATFQYAKILHAALILRDYFRYGVAHKVSQLAYRIIMLLNIAKIDNKARLSSNFSVMEWLKYFVSWY